MQLTQVQPTALYVLWFPEPAEVITEHSVRYSAKQKLSPTSKLMFEPLCYCTSPWKNTNEPKGEIIGISLRNSISTALKPIIFSREKMKDKAVRELRVGGAKGSPCQRPPSYMWPDAVMEKRHGQLALLHDNFVWILHNCTHFFLKFL